jgi:fructokinase
VKLGLDIGGTKIEVAVLDGAGAPILQRRVATPSGYEKILTTIFELTRNAEQSTGQRVTVGVGCPGGLSPHTGLMQNVENIPSLNDRPFARDLEQVLDRPVRVANDADCFALSEASDGAGAGANVVLGVILGTGCGSGLVMDGRILRGANAAAGEWGHNSLPWPGAGEVPGPVCVCGKRGCMETYLSGPGFSRDHAEATGDHLGPPEIAERAANGDEGCRLTLDRYVDRLARAMASLINLVDPNVIVAGGGLAQIATLYHLVPSRWGSYMTGSRGGTRFVVNKHGDASGVRGAAHLWD